MLIVGLSLIFLHLVQSQDICQTVHCGSGRCVQTQNPSLPYFCRCPSGANTILPCPMENPCSRNPCGQGACEVVPSLVHGYLCRCAGDVISLTTCNMTQSGCYSNPCINGLCIEGLTSFFCHCMQSWTGKYCTEKIPTPCANNPCNPGRCFELNDPAIPFVCLCPSGQFGLSCRARDYYSSTARMSPTIRITMPTTTTTTTVSTTMRSPHACNPFELGSCMNGGRCLATVHSYRCLCQSGYTGHFCEMNINECASNPCQHGGICYDLQSSYMCFCPDGSFRSQCLPRLVSTSTARALVCPCQNGGVCPILGSQSCVCPAGFTGRYCEQLLRKTTIFDLSVRADASNSPFSATGRCNQVQCMNGGICHENGSNALGLAHCLCRNGYTGKFCETEYFRCRSDGRFADIYNCAQGKYFECIHFHEGAAANPYGTLLSRGCPASLRFNIQEDRCDYAQNVKCGDVL